jgi:hypothetical protein
MPFRVRRSFGRGPLRLSVSRRGVTPSARVGRVTSSPRQISVRLLRGISYVLPFRRRR